MANEKDIIRDSVKVLKHRGVIKYDSDIAKDLGYTRGAISELLNPKSDKPMTYAFMQKFKEHYGKFLNTAEIQPQPELLDRILILEKKVKVLTDTCIGLLAQSSGRQPALIAAELEEALKLYSK